MKRLIALILIILPLTILANGGVNDIKRWSDGALTWDDFMGDTMGGSDATSMDRELIIEFDQSDNKGNMEFQIHAVAAMNRNNSSVGANVKSDQNLRYQQLQYDLLELYRRRLQRFLNGTIRNSEFDAKLAFVQGEYNEKSALIAEETKNGADEKSLKQWEYFVAMELSQSEDMEAPVIAPSKFSYGGFVGVGWATLTNDLGDSFSSYFPFNIGLESEYNRFKLKVDVSYGQPKIENSNIYDVAMQGTYSTYASLLGVNVVVGYKVYKGSRFSITPFVGGSWSKYSWNIANYEYNYEDDLLDVVEVLGTDMSDFNWIAGIDFDYHFNHYLIGDEDSMQKTQMTSSVRFTPYVSYASYKDTSLSGYNVGLTVAYSVNFSHLKVK
ncbi:MAG: hypothetical protein R3Y22_05675 [Bacteroidales bacterium]